MKATDLKQMREVWEVWKDNMDEIIAHGRTVKQKFAE
jgi:hypothetical protein